MTRLDRAGLERIAEATGGGFFYQPKSVAMGEVVQIIDKMQKSELESRLTVKYAEMFQPFVLAGILILGLAFLVVPSWRRRLS